MYSLVPRTTQLLKSSKLVNSVVLESTGLRRMTILSSESKVEFQKQNYNERMQKTGRPVSPHVTIYALPITAITSITNRITGVTLSIGALGVAALELSGNGSALALAETVAQSSWAVPAKLAVGFPLTYHSMAALRHFYNDAMPETLTNADVERSSYVLLGASVVGTLGLLVL